MADSTPEYDAFGPWVLHVSSPAQVPAVFRSHSIDFTRAHDVLKVPRDIARRDVTPRTHLYDQLLVLSQDGLEVLSRKGHRFAVQRIARDAVVAIDSGTELLDGWLTVHGTDGSRVEVRFNGSSLPTITEFADRLTGRADSAPAADRASRLLGQHTLGIHDLGLVNAYNALARRRSGLEVTTAYPSRVPVPRNPRLHRMLRGTPHLSGAVVCNDGEDVVVLARREWVRYSRTPDLSHRRIEIIGSRVSSVSSGSHPSLAGALDVTVHGGAARIGLTVPTDSALAVAALSSTSRGPRLT